MVVPYTASAFFHLKATGSLELHCAYHAAYDSDAFSVDFGGALRVRRLDGQC